VSVEAFVVEAALALDPSCDPRAPGGAVTVELCGHWDHDGPCRWPHNSALDDTGTFRTLYVASSSEAPTVASRIEHALRAGPHWQVNRITERAVGEEERELASCLLAGPRAEPA
jgi:hypothetical protein